MVNYETDPRGSRKKWPSWWKTSLMYCCRLQKHFDWLPDEPEADDANYCLQI